MSAPRSGPAGALPLDRWPGVEEGPALQPQRLARRVARRPGRLRRRSSGSGPAALASDRRGSPSTAARCGVGAVGRRPPVGLGHGDGLVAQRVGEQRPRRPWRRPARGRGARAAGWSSTPSPPSRAASTAARVAAALDRWTTAPAAVSAAALEASPCGSPRVPVRETTTGRSRPADAAVSRAARIASASSGAGRGGRRGRGRGRAAGHRSRGRRPRSRSAPAAGSGRSSGGLGPA